MNKINAPWAMSGEDVLRESGGSHGGLNDEAARQRLAHFGANTLVAKDQEPWYLLFLEQFANPLVYMLIGAAAVKGYLKGLVDALVIAAALLIMASYRFCAGDESPISHGGSPQTQCAEGQGAAQRYDTAAGCRRNSTG